MSETYVIDDIFSSPENGVPKKLIITKDKALDKHEDYPMGSLCSYDTDTDDDEYSLRKSTKASSSSST